MGAQFNVSSDRLVEPGMEPVTPGLQGKWFIHYTTEAPLVRPCLSGGLTAHAVPGISFLIKFHQLLRQTML